MNKKIGILTSGGDSPGMNTAIRAIVKIGNSAGLKIYGIYNGYLGLYQNKFIKLNKYSVENLIDKGGTILGSSRFPNFYKKEIYKTSIINIKKKKLDIIVVIGGNGSYFGAKLLTKMSCHCICIPGTIDNDIYGTDYSIGYFTALETIVEAIDKLRDTTKSHNKISIIEIMGRYCGNLTISAAIAAGCNFAIFPEIKFNKQNLLSKIILSLNKGEKDILIAITENIYNVHKLAKYIEYHTQKETRATILGHIQRGGRPISFDRIIASKMGVYCVKLILNNIYGKCIGIRRNRLIHYDIKKISKKNKITINKDLLNTFKKIY